MDREISGDAISQFIANSIKLETQKVFNEVLAKEMEWLYKRVEKEMVGRSVWIMANTMISLREKLNMMWHELVIKIPFDNF